FLDHLCFDPGVLTAAGPTPSQWADIERGYAVAKGVAGLDVVQTVVTKEGGVLAVEAVEGTDRAIRRGCALGRGGAAAVKVAKPDQDHRFDVPTVGCDTLRALIASRGSVLAVEARRTLVVEGRPFVDYAEEHGIVVVSYEPGLEASHP